MNILVADDERIIANGLSAILERNGFSTRVAYDGKSAYQIASDAPFDAMVLDIMMPYMDGIEVLQKLRGCGDSTPVLLLTAKSQVEDKIEGLSRGADDYVAKPFNSGELVARLNSVIRRSRLTRTETLSIGGVSLSMPEKSISYQDRALSLSLGEARTMKQLIVHTGKYIPLQFIAECIADGFGVTSAMLYVNYLKDKLKSLGADVELIIHGSNGCELKKSVI